MALALAADCGRLGKRTSPQEPGGGGDGSGGGKLGGDAERCRAIGQPHREPLFTLSKLGLNCQYALLVEPHLDSALMLACTIGLLDLYGPASARII